MQRSFHPNPSSIAVAFLLSVLLSLGAAVPAPATADEVRTLSKAGKFEDVRSDLEQAIVGKGLVIDYNGHIGRMLERTGADVGSVKTVYKNAQYLVFCSAKLSRATMEADPKAIGFCPYVIFIYETAAKPGEIVVGYRRPMAPSGSTAAAALGAVEALLDGIVKEVVE